MNPFRTAADYELFLYTLTQQFPSLLGSSVTLVRLGASLARVSGELELAGGYRIVVRERLLLDREPIQLEWYGYEIWHGAEKLCWYDPQPHPGDLALAATFPHRRHEPPGIKHHRIPAPEMSFNRPNLPAVIAAAQRLQAARS
jgi:hypothetical protein